jgi:hypothetical protein
MKPEKNSLDEDSDTFVVAVDRQQALPRPHLATETVESVFCICKLWTNNLWISFLNAGTVTLCLYG